MAPVGLVLAAALAACGGDHGTGPVNATQIATISIDTPSFQLERGAQKILTATAKDAKGNVVTVPFAWHSTTDSIALFQPNGRLVAGDTGVVNVTASALGVTSPAIAVRVVWLGAAHLATSNWTPPQAATVATDISDSIRVLVTNRAGGPASGAKVVFAVTAGGGKVSVASDTSDAAGKVAARWTLGPTAGLNTVSATVVDVDGTLIPWVAPNPVTFSVTTFKALSIKAGDQQTGQILSVLPIAPSVQLVDSAGKPRQGIPVTFTPTSNGVVTTSIVSTGADGVASPGTWTLGDIPGSQSLIVRVESAELTVGATATGTPIHFIPSQLSLGGFATCAILSNAMSSCWGQQPLVGDGGAANQSKPTPTKGGVLFASIDGGLTHFCGVGTDQAVYCWGTNALVDTSGATQSVSVPTRLPSATSWSSVTAGQAFNCAVASDQSAFCWGSNASGQLGTGDTLNHVQPAAVFGGFKFSALAAGDSHVCGLTPLGSAFCWGLNTNGELGDGTTTQRVSPTVVGGAITFQSIGAGEAWSCGLSTDGKAYCWGGIPGGSSAQTAPQTYTGAPTFTSLTVGGAHACALAGDGTAYCWGANNFGQVGDSTTVTRTTPTPVAGGFKFKALSAGGEHTCGQTSDGSVVCWGLNRAGELGNNITAFQLTPRYIVLGVNP